MDNPDLNQNKPIQPSRLKFLIYILIASVAVCILFVYFPTIKKSFEKVESSPISNDSTIPGWNSYKHDVLGLSFSYPLEWGELEKNSVEYITHLKTLKNGCVDKIYEMDSRCKTITIGFNHTYQNPRPAIKIFSDDYEGEKYPNANAYHYGSTDNIPTLKQTGNICDYKINFEVGYTGSLKEIYSTCRDGVKISLVESTQDFRPDPIGIVYTYDLQLNGYKKLNNGIFDNILISYIYHTSTSTLQLDHKLTPEEFSKKTGLNLDTNEPLEQFAKFISSFNSYPPPVVQVPEFKKLEGEDENMSLIRQYYYLLAKNAPNDAYKFIGSELTSEEFTAKNLYKIYRAEPRDFKKIDNNKYEFWLEYQEHNKRPETQRHVVRIENNKIINEIQEILTSPVVSSGDKIAYASSRGEESLVILKENGQEKVVASAPNDFEKTLKTLIFRNVSFSTSGRYILYAASGWEWGYNDVYDTVEKKQVLREGSGYSGLNPEENLYFYCSSNDFSGDYGALLYDVPSFKVKLNILEQFPEVGKFGTSIKCEYNKESGSIDFTFKGKYLEDKSYDENYSKLIRIDPKTASILNE